MLSVIVDVSCAASRVITLSNLRGLICWLAGFFPESKPKYHQLNMQRHIFYGCENGEESLKVKVDAEIRIKRESLYDTLR